MTHEYQKIIDRALCGYVRDIRFLSSYGIPVISIIKECRCEDEHNCKKGYITLTKLLVDMFPFDIELAELKIKEFSNDNNISGEIYHNMEDLRKQTLKYKIFGE